MTPDGWAQIIAAVVGVILGGGISLIVYLVRNRKGNMLVVKRVSETPQITLSPEIRKRLDISYKGQAIKDFVVNTLEIRNDGSSLIEPMEITFKMEPKGEGLQFFEVEPSDPLSKTSIDIGIDFFTVKRPFINRQNAYKEEIIKLAVFSNSPLKISVEGGGKDWYSKLVFHEKEISKSYSIIVLITTLGLLTLLVALVSLFSPALVDFLKSSFGSTSLALFILVGAVLFSIMTSFTSEISKWRNEQ